MEKLGYDSYEAVMEGFSWGESWELVDGTRGAVNTTHECIDRHVGRGEAVRLSFEDGSTAVHTFGELSRGAARFAWLLEDLGVGRGERVAVVLDPCFEFLAGFFGAMARGAVAVPCSPLFGPEGLRYRLEDADPSLLIAAADALEAVDSGAVDRTIERDGLAARLEGYPGTYDPSTGGEDPAWIQYTSGTTGRPDPYTYHHKSTVYWGPVIEFSLDLREGDPCFTTATTGWGAGIWDGLFAPLLFGVPTGFRSGPFDPGRVLDAFEEFGVNAVPMTMPTACRKLIDAARERDRVPELAKLKVGGEPLDAELSRRIEATFGATPRQQYGVTELRTIVSMDYAYDDYEPRHGSMGKPLPGVDVRIVDGDGEERPPGEVGYVEVRRSGEWIRSDDAAYIDDDGYLWSAGRMDDTIISAGYTIGPQEVEDALRAHPAVEEAGVIGVPDEERGEVVKAFVSTDEPDEDLKGDLREHVRERLSKHEYPREIEVVGSVPTTPDGKVRRGALREREGVE